MDDQRNPGRHIEAGFNGQLRPEQAQAAQALLEQNMGVLSAATAFGKTVIGAYLIGQRQANTLILVHSSALLAQWKAALAYAQNHPSAEVSNLWTGRGYSVLEIVAAFERVNNLTISYVVAPRRPGDIARCYADPQKAVRVLGWKAGKTLEDMCRDSWRWQQYVMAH